MSLMAKHFLSRFSLQFNIFERYMKEIQKHNGKERNVRLIREYDTSTRTASVQTYVRRRRPPTFLCTLPLLGIFDDNNNNTRYNFTSYFSWVDKNNTTDMPFFHKWRHSLRNATIHFLLPFLVILIRHSITCPARGDSSDSLAVVMNMNNILLNLWMTFTFRGIETEHWLRENLLQYYMCTSTC